MPIHICTTCGTSYPDTRGAPSRACPICQDERQFSSRCVKTGLDTPTRLAEGTSTLARLEKRPVRSIPIQASVSAALAPLASDDPKGNCSLGLLATAGRCDAKRLVRPGWPSTPSRSVAPRITTRACTDLGACRFVGPSTSTAPMPSGLMRPDSAIRHGVARCGRSRQV